VEHKSVKDNMIDLWVVGKVTNADHGSWELQGVFSSEKRALAAAVGKHDFIGMLPLDYEAPRETTQWLCDRAWYPNLENKPEDVYERALRFSNRTDLKEHPYPRNRLWVDCEEELKAARDEINQLREVIAQYGNTMGLIAIAVFGETDNNRTDAECIEAVRQVASEIKPLRDLILARIDGPPIDYGTTHRNVLAWDADWLRRAREVMER
jgi:hypothetical protein